ncbi:MAG TPA: hypothetical protein VMF30_14955 [Pirellulales bacterium]|nr:hypothetical protein [Pirellulales bacterium]
MAESNDKGTARTSDVGSEADFLAEQAAAAQRALSDTLRRMKADLGDTADLAAWARRYPWPTVGIAAAAGFLVAKTMFSPASAHEVGPTDIADEETAADSTPRTRGARRRRSTESGLFRSLLAEVLRNFANAAQAAIVAAIGARFQAPQTAAPATAADPSVAAGGSGNGFAPADPVGADASPLSPG